MTSLIDAKFVRYKIRRHARRRCKQRLGIKLTTKLERQIIAAIKAGKYIYLKPCKKPSRMMIDVDLGSQIIRVVYCTAIKQIITVLARDPKSNLRQ